MFHACLSRFVGWPPTECAPFYRGDWITSSVDPIDAGFSHERFCPPSRRHTNKVRSRVTLLVQGPETGNRRCGHSGVCPPSSLVNEIAATDWRQHLERTAIKRSDIWWSVRFALWRTPGWFRLQSSPTCCRAVGAGTGIVKLWLTRS